jgi:hypothetical protein
MEIGIISEGCTDQIVIESIIQAFLSDKNIILDPLQPKFNEQGGWTHVFNYCRSADFREALPYKNFIVINIDCDVLKGGEVPEECKMELNGLSIDEVFERVKQKLIDFIGEAFFQEHRERILFAIAVDEIECWFLPLYFPTKPAFCNKVSGCIDKLNTVLKEQEGLYINSKNPDYYTQISKRFLRKGALQICQKNESFKIFHDQLDLCLK